MPDGVIRYPRYRFPPAIISHAVWLYYRFTLSFRDVEDLLALRGITVSYETVRRWCQTFGLAYARRLRRHRSPRQLPGRTSQRHAVRRARHHTLRQQPSRSLAPAHAATRGSDAALQVRGPGTAILSVHGVIRNLFNVGRHLLRAGHQRLLRTRALATWSTCRRRLMPSIGSTPRRTVSSSSLT